MNELTLELDCLGHKDLKEYLLSLTGVFEVNIELSENLIINIRYNPELMNFAALTVEILLFLDKLKTPSIISFNKHTKTKTIDYKIAIKDLCCEYCLKGMIYDLLMTSGIENANSDFEDTLYQSTENVIIYISYDPKLISKDQIKKIELKFNS